MRISRIIDSERRTQQTNLNKSISAEHPYFPKRPFGGSWKKKGGGEGRWPSAKTPISYL